VSATAIQARRLHLVGCLIVLAAILAVSVTHSVSAAEAYSEDSVKAAFIYRFAGYVEWPRSLEPEQAFYIAVMGSNDMVLRLQTMVVDRTLHNRPVKVRKVSSIQESTGAQILYIGPEHRTELRGLLAAVGAKDMLVVTDEEHGLDVGSTINFLMVDHRVRFEVSLEAAHRAGLAVSSELLSVAARVQGGRSR
jgi:hypothetical protein